LVSFDCGFGLGKLTSGKNVGAADVARAARLIVTVFGFLHNVESSGWLVMFFVHEDRLITAEEDRFALILSGSAAKSVLWVSFSWLGIGT
jgi:hypothetical protein